MYLPKTQKTYLRTHLKRKYGILLSQFWRILDGTPTFFYGKTIIICLIQISVGVINDGIICSKTPVEDLAPINEMKEVLIHIRYNIAYNNQEQS